MNARQEAQVRRDLEHLGRTFGKPVLFVRPSLLRLAKHYLPWVNVKPKYPPPTSELKVATEAMIKRIRAAREEGTLDVQLKLHPMPPPPPAGDPSVAVLPDPHAEPDRLGVRQLRSDPAPGASRSGHPPHVRRGFHPSVLRSPLLGGTADRSSSDQA